MSKAKNLSATHVDKMVTLMKHTEYSQRAIARLCQISVRRIEQKLKTKQYTGLTQKNVIFKRTKIFEKYCLKT